MVMDVTRSCYRTTMQFFPGLDYPIPVRWYRTVPGALCFPAPHNFYSRNWDYVHDLPQDVGETTDAPRPYSKQPAPFGARGDHFCGPLEWFQKGVPADTFGDTYERNAFGLLVCCNPLERDAGVKAGELSGGAVDAAVLCAGDAVYGPGLPPVLYAKLEGCETGYVVLPFNPFSEPQYGIVGPGNPPASTLYQGGDILGNTLTLGVAWGDISPCEVVIVCNNQFPDGGNYLGGASAYTLVSLSPLTWKYSGADLATSFPGTFCKFWDVTVSVAPFPGYEVGSLEQSGGGVDVVPSVSAAVGAREQSGGGVQVNPWAGVVAGEQSGGGVDV